MAVAEAFINLCKEAANQLKRKEYFRICCRILTWKLKNYERQRERARRLPGSSEAAMYFRKAAKFDTGLWMGCSEP